MGRRRSLVRGEMIGLPIYMEGEERRGQERTGEDWRLERGVNSRNWFTGAAQVEICGRYTVVENVTFLVPLVQVFIQVPFLPLPFLFVS